MSDAKPRPTAGALAAAYEIILAGFGDPGMADEQAEFLATIIDERTAAPDLLAACKAARLTYLALARNIDVLVKLLNDAGLPSSWLVLELSKLEKVSAAITRAEAKP